jgi:hypothetical protein
MAGITTYLSILTLNANVLNSPIKRYHLAKWIKKEDLGDPKWQLGHTDADSVRCMNQRSC